eukprot:Skav208493  [mRNA]  locus=scaffold87:187028:193385:- [translate_table: standard]
MSLIKPFAMSTLSTVGRRHCGACDRLCDALRSVALEEQNGLACSLSTLKWLIEQDEVGVVMRYLGQFPSESDLKETIIPELLEEDPSKDGMVSFEAFERLMLRCLSDHTYDPDDSETLLAAFRVLDPQGHGYIDSNLMHEWLSTKGGKASDFFKERETSDFLEYAKDKDSSDSSRIYYEDYVAKLNADIEKHLESLYQAARGSGGGRSGELRGMKDQAANEEVAVEPEAFATKAAKVTKDHEIGDLFISL